MQKVVIVNANLSTPGSQFLLLFQNNAALEWKLQQYGNVNAHGPYSVCPFSASNAVLRMRACLVASPPVQHLCEVVDSLKKVANILWCYS